MRYLAIDYGEKRTGLAICDAGERIASPLAVLEGQTRLVSQIIEVIKREDAEAIVMGLPLNMDGTEGPQAELVRRFAEQIKTGTDIPVFFHDERLTSFDAESKLAGEFTRKKKKKRLDAVAAASILESFLDQKHTQ